jgi:hypothetical protein
MTIKTLSRGIIPLRKIAPKVIYYGACMECWSTFTYEKEDLEKSVIEFGRPDGYKILKCPECATQIHITTPIPYLVQSYG